MLNSTNDILLSLNDVTIVPSYISNIESRKECNVFYENGKLPLFTAPMSCVIDSTNWKNFNDIGVNSIVPRNIDFETRLSLSATTFSAIGLDELKQIIDMDPFVKDKQYFCVDIANGHMKLLYDLCAKAKERHGDNISIMTGNIANPETYEYIVSNYPEVIDYIRVGIGGGSACTTSANTSIHYPMASLLSKCYVYHAYREDKTPKIVADGGFKNFDQIIKALAIGADYVMLGNIFAKCNESCAPYLRDENGEFMHDEKGNMLKTYYGMSTKKAQQEFGGLGNKTAEGIARIISVEYSLSQWIDNFISYLKSAMSYTNCKSLIDFVGGPVLKQMTNFAYSSYFK